MPVEMSNPTKWPGMKVGEKNYPKNLDKSAKSGSYTSRTGNSNGIQKKRNKGGKRSECVHQSHGPCACKN